MVASTGYSLGLMILDFLPRGSLISAGVIMFLPRLPGRRLRAAGPGHGAPTWATRSGWTKGKHRQGLLYAMITSVEKIAGALCIGLTFTVLAWSATTPRKARTTRPAAIHGLELVYLLGPIVFVMLGGACYIGYKLDSKRHAEIRDGARRT